MSGIEIFSLVVEVVGLAKKAYDVADKAAHAEQAINNLVERLLASKKALERATSCFESLPTDDRPTDLVNSILAKYNSLLLYMREELQNSGSNTNKNKSEGDGHHLRRVFGKVSKGAKWVIKEEWVQGRIDEIKELEKVIQDTLQVLTTINSHGAAKTTVEVQKLLQKVTETTDVSNFFSEVSKLYRALEKNPQQILARLERSPPGWVLEEAPAKAWLEQQAGGGDDDDDSGNWLWVLGDAGTGKSCIATYVSHALQETSSSSIDTLSELNRPSSQLGSADRHVLPIRGSVIYYCNYQSPESQVPERVALTLLHQLMTQLWEIAPHRAYRHLAAVRDLTTFQGTQRGVQDAFRVLSAVAESFDSLYVTIDALDELPISNLATLLQRLRGLTPLPGVKFFVTSRDTSRVLPTARTVNANRNASTIRAFVHEKLKSIAGGRDPDISWPVPLTTMLADDEGGFLAQVEERILELSGENFFCADLMIKQLLDCQEEDEVQQSLDKLSRTVDGLITQALDRINAQDAAQAARGNAALLWVIYTRGPSIGLTELQHALAFQFYGDNPTTSPESHLSEFSRAKLTKFTCNFLSFEGGSSGDGGSESISVHKAVQDFCVGEGMGAQYFHDPHAVIARDWERVPPFLRYAASNWGWHMAASSQVIPDCPPPNLGLMELLGDDPFLDIVTVAVQPKLKELGMWTKDMWDELRTKKPPISALQILAFFDLDRVVAKWLEKSRTVNAGDTAEYEELLSSALYLAAIQGSHRTALLLLSHGADPLRENGKMGLTALQGACLQGHVDAVDALFRNTSDELCVEMVSHKNRDSRTALLDACSSTHVVKRILGVMSQMDKPGARVLLLHQSGRAGQAGNAMHSAAEADNPDVIDELLNFRPGGRMLLDEPCSRNGETPLHRAARVGSANAVRRLLERGANPNALDQHGNTAAMLAANEVASLTGGCLELLLPHTDLKVQNTLHRLNILHTACHFGRARHVKALLPYLEKDQSVLSAREDGNLLPIMCASLRPHHFKFLCIEHLIPLMGRDLLPVKDAQELQRILMRHNQPQAFALLLKEFPDQQKLMMNRQSTLLSKAIARGHLPIVEAILTVYGKSDLEVRNPEGLTPLMQAAHLGYSDIVRYLLDNGADINAIGSGDRSALEWCAELNDADIVEAIWQHDPELLKPTPNDDKVLKMVSARNHSIRGSNTWLEIAVKRGDELMRQVEFSYIKLNTNQWDVYEDTWEVDEGFEIPCKKRLPQNYDKAGVKSLMALIRPGDRLCVLMRAQFAGWACRVSRAELTAWYEDGEEAGHAT
ncbi:hypothetical protein F5Y08DRAFT_329581 [Xylaria arbuscula]|nr:hypothetical protein F5Y08DRAFT_329581 [Xylaria arbuscula]